MLKVWGEIRDPVHGYILITEVERAVIDSYVVQRLHRVKQLAGAQYTYPGAEHSRFSHSLGVLHLAGELAEHLAVKGFLDEDEVQKVRLAGVLHDVGHGPFSHLYEEISLKYLGKTHEDLAEWLIRESELKDILGGYGYEAKEISQLAVGRLGGVKPYLSEVIASTVDVDKMDFLVRDSYFTGVEYGLIDIYRLIYSTEVIDGHLAVEVPGALYALEAYLVARYEMFKALYFHRSVRSAEVMIVKAMDYAYKELGLVDFKGVEDFLALDDWFVSTRLGMMKDFKDRHIQMALTFLNMLNRRQLLKCSYETTIHLKDRFMASLLTREDFRRRMEEEIARKAGIDPSSIIIDVPTVPSIPYNPHQIDPMEIPIFSKETRERLPLSTVSDLVNPLKGYVDILRAYTFPQYRKQVEKASKEVLGSAPPSTKIFY